MKIILFLLLAVYLLMEPAYAVHRFYLGCLLGVKELIFDAVFDLFCFTDQDFGEFSLYEFSFRLFSEAGC